MAPASASATTSRWRCPTTRARTTSPSAPSGRTRRTCCASPTADRGSTTSRRRSSGTARCASTTSPARPARGRMSLWPSNSAQTISFGGYTKLARKTQVTGFFSYGLWSNDEPLQPFTINSTLPPIALPRANTDAEAHVFSTNLNLTSRPTTDWRFGARFRNYTYDNQMPVTQHHAATISYDAGPSTTPTGGPDLYAHDRTNVRRRRDLERDDPARADRRLHAQRQRLRRADLSVERRGRLPGVGRRRGILHDHLPRAIRGRLAHRIGARRTRSSRPSASTRRCGTSTWPTGRETASRGRSTSSRRTPGCSACRAGSCTTTSATPSSGCRSRPGAPSRSPPTTTCRTAWARARTYNLERYAGLQQSHEGDSSDRRSSTIRCATGRPTRRRPSTISPSTRRRPASAATPRCGSAYDFSHAERQ